MDPDNQRNTTRNTRPAGGPLRKTQQTASDDFMSRAQIESLFGPGKLDSEEDITDAILNRNVKEKETNSTKNVTEKIFLPAK